MERSDEPKTLLHRGNVSNDVNHEIFASSKNCANFSEDNIDMDIKNESMVGISQTFSHGDAGSIKAIEITMDNCSVHSNGLSEIAPNLHLIRCPSSDVAEKSSETTESRSTGEYKKLVIEMNLGDCVSESKSRNISMHVEKTATSFQDCISKQEDKRSHMSKANSSTTINGVKQREEDNADLFIDHFLSNRKKKRIEQEEKNKRDSHVHFIAIPRCINASHVISLFMNYLPAFRCLHRVAKRPIQPSNSVLVLSGNTAMGRAVISLALLAGASPVYAASSSARHHKKLAALGAIPLATNDLSSWSANAATRGSIDLMIDAKSSGSNSNSTGEMDPYLLVAALKSDGRLVRVIQNNERSRKAKLRHASSLRLKKIHDYCYNIFQDMENDTAGFRRDIRTVFNLFECGSLLPCTNKDIPVFGIDYAEIRVKKAIL